jgi:hypothetical protein
VSQIIIPRTGARVNGGRLPRTEDYVNSFIRAMRAETRKATVFTSAGRAVVQRNGERIIYAPNAEKIRVVELPEGGNQVEHGDHLHAHVRADCVSRPIIL